MKICSIDNCTLAVKARGWCEKHYKYWIRRGKPEKHTPAIKICSVDNCSNRNQAKGLCQRHYFVMWKYGVSPNDYERMLENQLGLCAICNKKCTSGKDLAVDHDHETGIVRGLLCQSCNWGIGNFSDDIKIISNAIAYLSGVSDSAVK